MGLLQKLVQSTENVNISELQWTRTYIWSEATQELSGLLEGPFARIAEADRVQHAVAVRPRQSVSYARNGNGWVETPITEDFDYADRIVIGTDGPAIAYLGQGRLRAARASQDWATEVIDDQVEISPAFRYDLELDASGTPTVCYADDSGLYIARPDGDGWTRELQIGDPGVRGCALAFRGADLHLLYVQIDPGNVARLRYYR